jgi:hypothetical protein
MPKESHGEKVEKVFQAAVREAIKDHAKAAHPISFLRKGILMEALLDPKTLEPIWEREIHAKNKEEVREMDRAKAIGLEVLLLVMLFASGLATYFFVKGNPTGVISFLLIVIFAAAARVVVKNE